MSTAENLRQTATTVVNNLEGSIFLGGRWQHGSSERTIPVTSVSDDAELGSLKAASTEDVDRAYERAESAQREWAEKSPAERATVLNQAADILERRRDEVAALLRVEAGSTLVKCDIEIGSAIGITREAATFPSRMQGTLHPSGFPGKENRVYREPRGVVTVISPWNFPLHLAIRSVSPALAVGNAVVLKPASDTPVVGGLLIAQIFEEAGLPEGVLSVLPGSGSEIGDYLVEHKTPAMISFTGSTPVGQRLGALAIQGHTKHLALELGGNAPVVVLDDADINGAVNGALMSAFLHQGQICMAGNRIIVQSEIYDKFVERFVERVKDLPVGDSTEDDTIIGPIINNSQLESVTELVESARKQGATPAYCGEVSGRSVGPQVFSDVTEDMDIATHEIFGPAIGILKASTEEEALRMANNTEFGLSSAVFTRDVQRGVRFARGIKAGMTHVNDSTVNDEPHVMFGGEKNSGIGRFNGEHAIEDFTTLHWVGVRDEMGPVPF
ncbi:aldehyde dehydrogenase family protein [Auritidibacter ignavus]|uniref:aldehyde dehydrogenase family protein n=1 Tax=Auritidibacter ignavus TaxID=678932 RepID=UPI00109CD060|nr:aldehyde dehydrogenase family protein [Auritidibacter ignavus]